MPLMFEVVVKFEMPDQVNEQELVEISSYVAKAVGKWRYSNAHEPAPWKMSNISVDPVAKLSGIQMSSVGLAGGLAPTFHIGNNPKKAIP